MALKTAPPPLRNNNAPFTRAETVKVFLFGLFLPGIFLAPTCLLGAWIHTFPSIPSPWFGLLVTIATTSLAYVSSMVLLLKHPRIVRERMSKLYPDDNDDLTEKRFFRLAAPLAGVGYLFVAWNASRQGDTFPYLWNYVGSLMLLVGFLWIAMVFRENPFASKIVYKQEDQRLITTGPYQIVRHPMYLGVIFLVNGFSLSLGSFLGILPMSLFCVLTGWRTYHEEQFLLHTFSSDYVTYCTQVKYRMIPLVF